MHCKVDKYHYSIAPPALDIDFVIGLSDIKSPMFVRLEANMMEFDDVKLTNSNDSTKSIEATGIEGYGARVSIGRSF